MSAISIELPAKEGREIGLVAHGEGRYTITGVSPDDIPKPEPTELFTVARLKIKRPGIPDDMQTREGIEVCAFKVGTGSRSWSVSGPRDGMELLEIEGRLGRTARWSELVDQSVEGTVRTFAPSPQRR